MFNDLPVIINLAIFIALGAMIWVAGTRLSYFLDAIAEQTHIARAFLGLILLASATELPEFVTTITASSTGNGTLALNNMFGGMLLQLLVLAAADFCVKKGTLSSRPYSTTVVAAGVFCILIMAFILIVHGLGDYIVAFHVGAGGLVVTVLYVGAMYVLKQLQSRDVWSPVDLPQEAEDEAPGRNNKYDEKSLKFLIGFSSLAAISILVFGVLLVQLADTLANQTGLGSSFIGASLLALTTSMPELSTTIAAIRVKAYTMAISNIFGSNLIMSFLLFPNELAFTSGSIINEMDKPAVFALGAAILMTSVYCLGMLSRPKHKFLNMGIDSLVLVGCYIISLWVMYLLR